MINIFSFQIDFASIPKGVVRAFRWVTRLTVGNVLGIVATKKLSQWPFEAEFDEMECNLFEAARSGVRKNQAEVVLGPIFELLGFTKRVELRLKSHQRFRRSKDAWRLVQHELGEALTLSSQLKFDVAPDEIRRSVEEFKKQLKDFQNKFYIYLAHK